MTAIDDDLLQSPDCQLVAESGAHKLTEEVKCPRTAVTVKSVYPL
jgi:hypothetical protein